MVELSPELSSRLDAALAKLDRIEPKFKESRDEERSAQTSKMWSRTCTDIDGHLRAIARALFTSHQLNLDIGSDGGGTKTQPWIEEMSQTFERLYFTLKDGEVVVTSGTSTLMKGRTKDADYAWLERAVVDWVIGAAEKR